MNSLFYKLIFSKQTGTLVVVGEHTHAHSASSTGCVRDGARPSTGASGFIGRLETLCAATMFALLMGAPNWAIATIAPDALPVNGVVQSGQATISSNGAMMEIVQGTDKTSINWQSFSVGQSAAVNVQQNSANAVLLNRVVGSDPSQIMGKITANGQIILVNPNGIIVGPGGMVSASSFTATTFALDEQDFQSGQYRYYRNGSTAAVVNEGTIETAAGGGYVALIGAQVTNAGTIEAPGGTVVLAAGDQLKLPEMMTSQVAIPLSSKVKLEIAPATINTAITNTSSGVIVTDGGQVLVQTSALASAVAQIVQSGVIDASGTQGGDVRLLAEGGSIEVSGIIKTNSADGTPGGDIYIGRDPVTGVLAERTDVSGATLESRGGFVETSGHELLVDGAKVIAREWLLDPDNIEITNAATASAGYSKISASTLSTALNGGTSITIATTTANQVNQPAYTDGVVAGEGNILVSSAISKTSGSDASLTLEADNGIAVNANIGSTSGALNITMIAKGQTNGTTVSSMSDAERSLSKGIFINAVTLNANAGDIALTGTSYASASGNANASANNAVGKGIQIHASTTLRARDITLTGTAINQSGQNSTGVLFQRFPSVASLTASRDITVVGTVSGGGNGNGLSFLQSGWGAQTPTMTAGGNITLHGKNEASATNSSSAVNISSGLQARAVGNIVIKAETNNKNTDAIVFFSDAVVNPTYGTQYGNVSLRSVDSNNVASGNILIQANQGRVMMNNQLPSTHTSGGVTAVTDIIGKNITIDNTGGSYDGVTGNVVAGTGQAGPTLGGVVLSDTRNITATGNITVVGQSEWSSGVFVKSTLTANTGTIDIRSNKNVLVQGVLSARDVTINTTGGDIIQSANITGTQTVSLTTTGTGKSISRTAGILSGGLVRMEAANAIGGDDSGTTINRMQLATSNLSLKAGGGIYATGSSSMTVAGQTSGTIKVSTTAGDLTVGTVSGLTGITTAGTVDLNAAGAIVQGSGKLTASTLNLKAGTTIGSSSLRLSTTVDNLSADSGGDQFITEDNAVTVAAQTTNNGSIDIQTTNGTLAVRTVNGLIGLTAHGSGNIVLTGVSSTGSGIDVLSAITTTGGDITLDGTTSSSTADVAGIKSSASISGANVTLLGEATNSTASTKTLGYYGAGGNLTATTGALHLTGTSLNAGNGFYSYGGTLSAAAGITINGSSQYGQGVGLDQQGSGGALVNLSNGSGGITITGTTQDATKQAIHLRGATITNNGGDIRLQANGGLLDTKVIWAGVTTATRNEITNSGSGSVTLTAGTTSTSTAAIDGTALTITQNGSGGVHVATTGLGNVTAPKIINNGTGDVVIGAGTLIAAGTSTGGNVKTFSSNDVTNASGKTYVYTGSTDSTTGTGDLSFLSSDFSSLYYNGTSNPLNAAFNTAYNGTITGGANQQVLFRQATAPGFTLNVPGTQLTKTYGDTDPTSASVIAAIKADYVAGNGATILTTQSGSNDFALAADDVFAAMGVSRASGQDVAGGTPYTYTLSASSLNTTVAGSVGLVINPATLSASLSAQTKTYDGSTTASWSSGTILLSGFAYGDSATVTTSSGVYDSKDVTSATTVSATLTSSDISAAAGTDLANYVLPTSVSGAGEIIAKQVSLSGVVVADKAYDGNTSATITNDGSLSGLVSTETLQVSNLTASFSSAASGQNKLVSLSATLSDDTGLASNYVLGNSVAYASITGTGGNGGNGGSESSGTVSPGPVYIQPVDNRPINTLVTTFSGTNISGASAQAASSSSGPSSQGTSFSLASEGFGGEDFCATDYGNRFKDCHCEDSAVRSGLQICYETSRKN